MHPCNLIYSASGQTPPPDGVEGICRITGQPGRGIPFEKWVKPTFTDYAYLHAGDIISHEAAFCFDEASTLLQQRVGKDKPQRMRNYSHFVVAGEWYPLSKADYDRMLPQLLSPDCQLAVIADSGQKHLIFKARPGWWQLEEQTIRPDRARFLEVHALIRRLAGMGFSQSAIASGNYPPGLMLKMNILQLRKFQEIEAELSRHRGCDVFDLAIKFWKHDIHERANS